MNTQTIRYNADAEKSVLGGVLQRNDVMHTARTIVTPEDFYHPAHALIWEAMTALATKHEPIDRITLTEELTRMRRASTALAAVDLDELEYFGMRTNVEAHARIIAGLAVARRIERSAKTILAKAGDGAVSVTELAEFASSQLTDSMRRRDGKRPKSMLDCADEFFAQVERAAANRGKITGLTTGFRSLDALTSGLHPGQLILIAARPKMGKSALAVGMAQAIAGINRKPVLIFSLEMSRLDLFGRMACGNAGVQTALLRNGGLDQRGFDRLMQSTQSLSTLPIWVQDDADVTLYDIREQARCLQASDGLGAIVVDYLQLGRASQQRVRGESREREIAELSRGLKKLAMELGVPVIALSQLNRSCESRQDKRPMPSDLRDSGALEQDADAVMFIYRDVVYNRNTEDPGAAEIIVALQRNGPTGTVMVRWEGMLTRFADAEPDEPLDAPVSDGEEWSGFDAE
jgi:replicative DNA helicase